VITYLPSHYLNHHECILSDYYSISAVAVEAAEIAYSRRRLKQKMERIILLLLYYYGSGECDDECKHLALPVTHTRSLSTNRSYCIKEPREFYYSPS
jgi:hypothetical protein